jgi:protein phosphatase
MCNVVIYGASDVGLQRKINEDRFGYLLEKRLAVVCDGMGGHAAGEVASRTAVDTIIRLHDIGEPPPGAEVAFGHPIELSDEARFLASTVRIASTRVHRLAASNSSLAGMGTTVVAAVVHHGTISICHVGDSRVYRIRKGSLSQLTSDHSLLNELIASKQLRSEDAADFPNKNVITRALGVRERVRVDVREDAVAVGDVFLLCSDGLSGFVSDEHLLRIVTANTDDIESMSRELIAAANAAGGEDNITCVLVRVTAADERDDESSELRMTTFPEESDSEFEAQRIVARWLDETDDHANESNVETNNPEKSVSATRKRKYFGFFIFILVTVLAASVLAFALNVGGARDLVLGAP